MQAQRYLLWRDNAPIGRLRFSSHANTATLDGLVLLPEAGGSVAAQVVGEALVRSAALGDAPPRSNLPGSLYCLVRCRWFSRTSPPYRHDCSY